MPVSEFCASSSPKTFYNLHYLSSSSLPSLLVPHSTSYSHARPRNHGWVLSFSYLCITHLLLRCPGTFSGPGHSRPPITVSFPPPNVETFLILLFLSPASSLFPSPLIFLGYSNLRPADVYRPDDSYRPYQVSPRSFLFILPSFLFPVVWSCCILRASSCCDSGQCGAPESARALPVMPSRIYEISSSQSSRIIIHLIQKGVRRVENTWVSVALSSNLGRSSLETS